MLSDHSGLLWNRSRQYLRIAGRRAAIRLGRMVLLAERLLQGHHYGRDRIAMAFGPQLLPFQKLDRAF